MPHAPRSDKKKPAIDHKSSHKLKHLRHKSSGGLLKLMAKPSADDAKKKKHVHSGLGGEIYKETDVTPNVLLDRILEAVSVHDAQNYERRRCEAPTVSGPDERARDNYHTTESSSGPDIGTYSNRHGDGVRSAERGGGRYRGDGGQTGGRGRDDHRLRRAGQHRARSTIATDGARGTEEED